MNTTKIIEQIRQLDLKDFPEQKVRELLTNLFSEKIPIVTTDFNTPKEIERAVNNTDNEPVFNSKKRISYKPVELNTDFLRASTPGNTMFYASVVPEDELSQDEIKYGRIIGASEVVDLLREDKDGERLVTFGKWEVQNTISVMTIFDPNKDYNVNYINKVRDFYNHQNLSTSDVKKRDEVLSFLAEEFSKKVDKNENYKYLISAIASELITNNCSDGILYPSVQSNGYGLCLALHPKVMDRLKLIKVLQCKIRKENQNITLLNLNACKVENDSENFELKSIQ